jgi:6,7-dimethyl-8-ribityllumazine synthase
MASELRGEPAGKGRRIAVAVARFNDEITDKLLAGARAALRERGVADDDVTVAWVPGAFELPLCCDWLCRTGRFDAVVALGAVVRGDTDHYDYVCSAATDGVLRNNLDHGTPVAFGVLTCDTWEQALARAGVDGSPNKGAEVALAALEMADLRQRVHALQSRPTPFLPR